jgi:flagellar hook assembly protein FlgD
VDTEPSPEIPVTFGLGQNYPNPFNPETRIQYDVARAGHITLEIYSVLGQKIRTLLDEQSAAGSFVITWYGRTEEGASAASGVYIYRFQSEEGFSQTRKLVLLR